MANDSDDLNFLHEHVLEGIWEKYSEAAYRRLIWTVSSNTAFFIMAVLAAWVGFAGSRSWTILRSVLIHKTGRPTRLHDDEHEEPLLHLSQGKAIWAVFPSVGNTFVRLWRRIKRSFGVTKASQSSATLRHDPAQSPLFGIVAIFNVALFLCMGVAIPVLLTDGALGSPIVQSKVTEECMNSYYLIGWLQHVLDLPRTDALVRQCLDEVTKTCDSQYFIVPPQIEKRSLNSCPFPREVCLNQTQPFEISHENISAYEVGINSPSTITLNHRLTCAPVIVEKFQLFPSFPANHSFISAKTNLDTAPGRRILDFDYSLDLKTQNGPNSRTNASSGLQMAHEDGPIDVTVLPKYIVALNLSIPQYQNSMNENIQRDDGQSFVIIYRAGISGYHEQVDDPFFAAHNKFDPSDESPRFVADHEATALGCVEQYQFCMPRLTGPIFCTSWGLGNQGYSQMGKIFNSDQVGFEQAQSAFIDWITFLPAVAEAISVYDYIALRNQMHGLLPLLRGQTSKTRISPTSRYWTSEVETWFVKAFISGIFRMRSGAKSHLLNYTMFGLDPPQENAIIEKWAPCGRVLFRDGDYTNINWIGLCATTAALSLICLASYVGERIVKYGKVLFRLLADLPGTTAKIRTVSRQTLQYCRSQIQRTAPVAIRSFFGFWLTILLYDMFLGMTRQHRSWYTGRAAAHMTGSNNENRPVPQTNMQDVEGYDLEELRDLEAIDNPI